MSGGVGGAWPRPSSREFGAKFGAVGVSWRRSDDAVGPDRARYETEANEVICPNRNQRPPAGFLLGYKFCGGRPTDQRGPNVDPTWTRMDAVFLPRTI